MLLMLRTLGIRVYLYVEGILLYRVVLILRFLNQRVVLGDLI